MTAPDINSQVMDALGKTSDNEKFEALAVLVRSNDEPAKIRKIGRGFCKVINFITLPKPVDDATVDALNDEQVEGLLAILKEKEASFLWRKR